MKNNVFKGVLLQALPNVQQVRGEKLHGPCGARRLQEEFHIDENLQLDDFPYVHMMRRIDNELQTVGAGAEYFTQVKSPSRTAELGRW